MTAKQVFDALQEVRQLEEIAKRERRANEQLRAAYIERLELELEFPVPPFRGRIPHYGIDWPYIELGRQSERRRS